jgi:hypothetical protein
VASEFQFVPEIRGFAKLLQAGGPRTVDPESHLEKQQILVVTMSRAILASPRGVISNWQFTVW